MKEFIRKTVGFYVANLIKTCVMAKPRAALSRVPLKFGRAHAVAGYLVRDFAKPFPNLLECGWEWGIKKNE